MKKRMFFDIETSFNIGIFWRSGYNQTIHPHDIIHERSIICICWKWEGEDDIYSLTWDKNQSDKSMLKKFLKELNKATEIVAHNGDKFDMKWLRTRALYHGLDMQPTYDTIDTLKQAKSLFNFNSNKLDYIAQYLKVGAKMETGGLDLWKSIVLRKDEVALCKMVDYCKQDVYILEEVFNKLNEYTKPKFNYAVYHGGEKFECPECGKLPHYKSKRATASGTIFHRMQCSDREGCKKQFSINNKTYIDYLRFKTRHGIK